MRNDGHRQEKLRYPFPADFGAGMFSYFQANLSYIQRSVLIATEIFLLQYNFPITTTWFLKFFLTQKFPPSTGGFQKYLGVEMAQWLNAHTAFTEDLSFQHPLA